MQNFFGGDGLEEGVGEERVEHAGGVRTDKILNWKHELPTLGKVPAVLFVLFKFLE